MDRGGHGGLAARKGAGRAGMWRTLGYMLNRTWITTTFFSVVLFQRYATETMAGTANEVYRSSVMALALFLMAFAALHRPVMALGQRRTFDYLGPALIGVGVALLVPSLAHGQAVDPGPLWASALFTGAGSALVLLALGRRFVGVDVRTCTVDVLWATVGSALLSLVIVYLPFAVALVVEALLPFLCVAALHQVPHAGQEGLEGRSSLGETISPKMLAKLVACAGVLGIMTGITRDLYLGSGSATLDQTFQMVNSAVPLVAALVLLGGIAGARRVDVETLYRPTVFVCTVAFALMPLTGGDIAVPFAVVSAGYTLFEVLVWVILSEVASRFQFTSVQVFGFGRAIVLLTGVIAGALIAGLLMRLQPGPALYSAVAAVAIVSISFLRTYVLTSSDLSVFDETEVDAESVEAAAQGEADPRARTGAESRAGTAGQPGKAAKPGEKKVPFQRKCAIIGDYYGLTRRETDVFRLLAAGRNSTRIQEELMISAGTVNTHSHHVFQKLDVHSQQEVIDLFQHADLDAMQAELAARQG